MTPSPNKTSRAKETVKPEPRAVVDAQGTDASPTRTAGRYQPGRNRRKDGRLAATFEGKREARPVLLGLGRNLSAAQRTRMQKRLYLIFASVVAAAIVLVAAIGVININFIQPNLPIVTVNGVNIPQKNYRYMVAYLAQDNWNKLQAAQVQEGQLNTQIASEKDPTKLAALKTQLQAAQASVSGLQTSFTLTQIDQLAVNDLIEDQLIQQQTPGYIKNDPKARAALTVTPAQITTAYDAFKKAFPAGESLSNFESQNHISDGDVHNSIALVLRRNAMDQYQQGLITSPTLQVDFARIQFEGLSQAQADLAAIQKDPSKWNALAKKDSLDVNTRDNGGDMGWNARGQQDQAIEAWVFAPGRKVGEMTTKVIKETTGTYDIVRIIGIDPARPLASTTVQTLKSNALSHWLDGLRNVPPTNNITTVNQDMLNSTTNAPQTPPLSTSTNTTAPAGGVPSGGVPAGGAPAAP